MAQSRAQVYLFRGLFGIFSLGMDTLANEFNKRGIHATSLSYDNWKSIANKLAADYKTEKEGPIILIGHSLGADAVMDMAGYLGDRGVPVALVVPFDATQSFPAPANVSRVLNLTQRDYAYMRPGPGFHGSLRNVDVSSDPGIDHLNIDKSPRLHAMVISEVLAIVGERRTAPPGAARPASIGTPAASHADDGTNVAPAGGGTGNPERPRAGLATSAKLGETRATKSADTANSTTDNSTPIIAQPKGQGTSMVSAAPIMAAPPSAVVSPTPIVKPRPLSPAQILD